MARKKINVSEKIREYIGANPDARVSEIVAGLKEQKLNVSASLVSGVRQRVKGAPAKKKKRGRPAGKPGRKPGVKAVAKVNDMVSMSALIEAKAFVAKVGGVEAAQDLIKTIAKLG